MTYKPTGSRSFGPPLADRLPAFAYFALVVAVVGVIVYGHLAPSTSRLFEYVVVGDNHRMISSTSCAIILAVSALAAILRNQMRGVVVHPDGIETRELLPLGLPRVRRFHWSQIDRVMVPSSDGRVTPGKPITPRSIGLALWDGSTLYLPRVANLMDLAVIIERVALARAIPIVGGTGLIDDLGNPMGDEEDA
jgi:hypothetical protein